MVELLIKIIEFFEKVGLVSQALLGIALLAFTISKLWLYLKEQKNKKIKKGGESVADINVIIRRLRKQTSEEVEATDFDPKLGYAPHWPKGSVEAQLAKALYRKEKKINNKSEKLIKRAVKLVISEKLTNFAKQESTIFLLGVIGLNLFLLSLSVLLSNKASSYLVIINLILNAALFMTVANKPEHRWVGLATALAFVTIIKGSGLYDTYLWVTLIVVAMFSIKKHLNRTIDYVFYWLAGTNTVSSIVFFFKNAIDAGVKSQAADNVAAHTGKTAAVSLAPKNLEMLLAAV